MTVVQPQISHVTTVFLRFPAVLACVLTFKQHTFFSLAYIPACVLTCNQYTLSKTCARRELGAADVRRCSGLEQTI